tara:strand:+ start:942 stop:1145 length:204 start_codon:yes stop_codon:yes gene_type:complete
MDEEKLNLSLRKFLKQVGINSQRIIEKEIRKQFSENKFEAPKSFDVTVELNIKEIEVNEKINGKIEV